MKDFKKMPKMAAGGCVGKYEDGGSVSDKFKEGVISRLKERFPDKEPQKVDRKPFENSAQRTIRQLRGSTGGGSMGGGDMSGMKGLDKPYKRGGKVKK